MTEHDFQRNIVRALQMQNIFVFAVPNGGLRGKFAAIRFKREGVMAGVTDLIALLPRGIAIFIEVKRPDKSTYLSESQKEFKRIVEELGFKHYLVDGWPSFEKMVEELRAIK